MERSLMENKRRKLLKDFFLIGFIACLTLLGRELYLTRQHDVQQGALKKMRQIQEPVRLPEEYVATCGGVLYRTGASEPAGAGRQKKNIDGQAGNGKAQDNAPALLEKYAGLYEKNHDLAGWIAIAGIDIDHPVMQCGDDEYYLNHDFYGEESKYGCLYVRERADVENGTNFIIYGHNMKDGSMFGNLDRYLEKSFFEENPLIFFDTLYEERVYEIVAVFRSQIMKQTDEVFQYYEFYEADTEEAFADFYRNIKELSLYDTGVEAAFGDTFLTLSTCAYHVKDGRLVVVAKRRPANG